MESVEDIEAKLLAVLNDDKQGATKMNNDKRNELMKAWAAKMEAPKESKNSKYFKAVEGKNKIRLIPGDYNGLPFVTYSQSYINNKYYIVDEDNSPFVDRGWEGHNANEGNTDLQKEERDKWLPGQKVAVHVLDDKGEVKIWNTSIKRMEEIVALSEDFPIFDLDEGHDIVLNRVGTGKMTRYSITPSPKSSKAVVDLDELEDLATFIKSQETTIEDQKMIVQAND